MGLTSADLNSDLFVFEVEMYLSAIKNMYCPYVQLFGQSNIFSAMDGYGDYSGAPGAAGWEMAPSVGATFEYPNGGKLFLRTPPVKIPPGTTTINSGIYFGFNASGGADTAQADILLTYMAIRKVNQ
jgi:hypothetical protein